jgi:hypothetical protein
MRQRPALPADDIGPASPILRQQRVRLLRDEIMQYRTRFPQFEIAVDQNGRTAVRIECQIIGLVLIALREIDELDVD